MLAGQKQQSDTAQLRQIVETHRVIEFQVADALVVERVEARDFKILRLGKNIA